MAIKRLEYFPAQPGAPKPLVAETERFVRFEDVDLMGIVWHGRYPSYFEDGRMAHGEKFGISYMDFIKGDVRAPVVQMHIDYQAPLAFGDRFTIRATLYWTDAAKLNYGFEIVKTDGALAAQGYTVQLLLDASNQVLFVRPPLVERLCRRWLAGEFDAA